MLDFLEKSNSIVFWKTEKQLIFGHFLPKYDQKWIFIGQSSLRKFLGAKEHLHWLKIDFNAAEITIVQNYKGRKN